MESETGAKMPQARICALAVAALLSFMWPREAAAVDHYGAIAFSQHSGNVGYSYNYRSRAAAEERALEECGRGCKVVVWFRNACGALATGDNNGYGSGWAASRREAERIALSGCGENVENCRVVRWVCTTR